MTRQKKIRLFALALIFLGFAGLSGCRGSGSGGGSQPAAYDWVTVDESYVPQDDVETFIKTDAANRGALPVYIRNYGSDKRVLNMFKGRQYAKPSPNALAMLNPGLENWKIVDIRYTGENEREIVRTVLYFKVKGVWKVGDSGTLVTP
ncbi:MAG: hypothetical protein ACYDH3_11285 [Candidatus Aminicenantales bacterium]